jgi:hypothetical protein
MRGPRPTVITAIAAMGLSAPALADDPQAAALQAQIESLQSQVQQLQQAQQAEQGNWLNEARATEVRGLIHEVLADASTRATLLQEGLSAGYDGDFFMEDGENFRLEIDGQLQIRYVWNTVDGDDDDDSEGGFTLRRTKVGFAGHIGSPEWSYDVVLAADRSGGDFSVEDFVIGWEINDAFEIEFGQFKLPFLREELLSSSRQLAVDRSSVTEYFTLDRGQGVQVSWDGGDTPVRAAFMVSDGADSESTDWDEDATDIAFTGRVDFMAAGDWGQAKDFNAYEGEEFGLFFGAAGHAEFGETGDAGGNDDIYLGTVDVLAELGGGVSVMGALNALFTDPEVGDDVTDWGFLLQGGVFVVPDEVQLFARYEFIDVDDVDEISLITAGVNYFINGHAQKFTLDAVYGLDPLFDTGRNFNDPASSGLGLRDDDNGDDGQLAIRAQLQLLF